MSAGALPGEILEVGPVDVVLDLSGINPPWCAAMAKAQAEVETVGKDGRNEEGRGYSYATGENMIRGSRTPLTSNGLAFISSWVAEPVEQGAEGDIGNQFVGAMVRVSFALTHADGGYATGTANMAAICSRRRPPDKAVAATLTYLRGFILRDLLNMDRDQVNPHEDTDQRADEAEGYQHQARRNGNGNGNQRPEGRRSQEPTAAEKDRAAQEAYAAKCKPLREKVMRLAKELQDRTHQGFELQRTAAKVPQSGRLSFEDLGKFVSWAEGKLDEIDGHAQAPAEEAPASKPEADDDLPEWALENPEPEADK